MLTKLDAARPWAVAAFRIVVGFLFFCHGASTLFGWFVTPHGGGTAEIGAWPGWYAGVIEFVAGLAIMLGIGTRLAAFLGSGTMAVAYFWMHQDAGLLPIQNDGVAVTLYCWSLLLLVFLGPGRAALSSLLTGTTDDPRAPARPAEPEPAPLPETTPLQAVAPN